MKIRIACAVVIVGLAGCKDKPTRTEPTTTASGSAQVDSSPIDRLAGGTDLSRRLALASSGGTSRVDQEISALQKAARTDETKSDVWILLGRAWVRKARESADPGFYLNADASADVALAISSSYAARDLKALVLLNQHKFEEARALASRIVEERPDDAMGYGSLSDACLELGRFDEAAQATQKMLDLKPNLPSYGRAAYIRWLQGDVATAKTYERKAIDAGSATQDPEPRAWEIVQSAHIFWHEGDYEGAEAGYDLALSSISEYPPALAGKGRAALSRGDAKRAADLLARAYKASPLVETAWLLGDARREDGDAKGAQEAYGEVEKHGRQIDPRTLAAYWATRNEKPHEALELAEAEKKHRGDIATEDALAWALYRNGRFADARAASDRALAHGTKDARLMFHAGAIRIATGDAKAGRKMIRDALALNPRFDVTGAAEARSLVGVDAGR